MKKILLKCLFSIILFSSCSTQQVRIVAPPSLNRLEVLKKSLISKENNQLVQNESEDLAKAYLLAMISEKEGNTKLACNLFTDLSENKNLAIKEAALVHGLSDCDFSESELDRIWKKTPIPNYLKEAYAEQSLKLAVKKNLPAFEAQFSFDLIAFRPIQAEKIKLITRAIEIAEKLKDADKSKIYSDRLKEISPLYNTEINEQNIYIIARDFEANRKFDTARSLYKKMIDGEYGLDDKVKAYNAFRTSYKVERDLKTFLLKTFEMEEFLKGEMKKNPEDKKSIEHWVDSKIALAKAVWTEQKNQEARKILDELIATKLGNINQLASTQLTYGSLYQESKEMTSALKCFKNAGTFKVTDLALSENIQWAIVWNNYLLKQNKKVVAYVDSFVKKSNNQNFIAKLNYWKAKTLQRMDKTLEANDVFTSVYTSDPFGYYGIIATIDLNIPLSPLSPTVINTDLTGFQILDWLIAMEEKTFSQKYLKEIDSLFKTPTERERAMSLYSQTEWYQGGMRQIYNFRMSSRNAMTEKYINIVFPTPYRSSVFRLGNKYSVPQELIFGITRQESAFVPSERSWADAFGLMQMIPEKAAELSKKYGIPYRDHNDLYDPDTNLEMGTALLKDLREKFNYKFIQSVAAYNASENVIKVWEKERFNGNYFEFIEMIPYEETRNYIKLVFRNYMTYKRITSKEEFIIDKDFFAKPF
ncbi:MAG: lytic transglycosylase domain-containing protein [Bacteriovorax sp.]|nr:lytic transglycosylase domain-containing protein [Bacteriovorax sp.]